MKPEKYIAVVKQNEQDHPKQIKLKKNLFSVCREGGGTIQTIMN